MRKSKLTSHLFPLLSVKETRASLGRNLLDEWEWQERISPENLSGLGYYCEGLARVESQYPHGLSKTLISSHVFLSSFALAGPEIVGLPMGEYC